MPDMGQRLYMARYDAQDGVIVMRGRYRGRLEAMPDDREYVVVDGWFEGRTGRWHQLPDPMHKPVSMREAPAGWHTTPARAMTVLLSRLREEVDRAVAQLSG